MNPVKTSYSLEITPQRVLSKIHPTWRRLEIPDGYTYTAFAIDLNTSYAITVAGVCFRPDTTAHVIYHETIPCKIPADTPDGLYNTKVHEALADVFKRLKALGVPIHGCAIDAGGRNSDVVQAFCKSAATQGIPCCAFFGRAANMWNPQVKSRLREAINNTVLCGSPEEHIKAGAGTKWILWNADFYKEAAQRALISPLGAIGSTSLYHGEIEEHKDFAL